MKRPNLITLIALCAILWCLGNITMLFIFDGRFVSSPSDFPLSPSSSSISVLFRNIKRAYRQYKERNDRRFPDGLNVSLTEVNIFLDWIHERRMFTIDNYRVLESVLSVYPNSIVRSYIYCPSYHIANGSFHRDCSGKGLSRNQFVKYQKRGYNIETIPIDFNNILDILSLNYSSYLLHSIHNESSLAAAALPWPNHLLFYSRIRRLYLEGGIYSDFSFFFLGTIFPDTQSHEVTSFRTCSRIPDPHSLHLPFPRSRE